MCEEEVRRQQEILRNILRQMRIEAGLRQIDVAQRVGQPQPFVSKYESGERRLDLVELGLLCEAMDTSLEELARRFQGAI